MTRRQRFLHVFQACRGPVLKREYHPPSGAKVTGRGPEAQQLIEEALYGVTLVHCRCRTCGATFTNRVLGDVTDVSV